MVKCAGLKIQSLSGFAGSNPARAMKMDNYYIDEKGYPRDCVTDQLIHRRVAYNKIYLKNRAKYSLPFSKYDVHHKDGNKRNCSVENLKILTRDQHKEAHGQISERELVFMFKWAIPGVTFFITGAVLYLLLFESEPVSFPDAAIILFIISSLWLFASIYFTVKRRKLS